MARVLIVDDDPGLLQMVRLMLERAGHQVMVASSGEAALAAVFGQAPDLALVDVMMPGMNGYDVTRAIREDQRTEGLPVIILTARAQPMDEQMAMDAGANAYLAKPVTAKELISKVSEVLANPERPESRPAAPPQPAARQGSVRQTATIQTEPEPIDHASLPTLPVTTVVGLRGGSGVTTIAVNLGMLLRERGDRVCLADLSMAGGHVALQLHLPAKVSWADLLLLGDRPDQKAIAAALTQHQPTGVAVMAAPAMPSMRSLSQEAMINVLSVLTKGFQHIVIDADNLNPASVGALLVSHAIVVVMGDDISAVHTTTNMLQSFQTMGIEMGRVRVAINRSRPESGVAFQTIMKALGRPVSADIPYDSNQAQALKYGTPLAIATPDAPFSQAMKQLLRTL